MTDTKKKIAEIRETLQKATPGPWEIVDIGGIEIAKDYKYKDGKHSAYWIAEMYQDEDMDEDQVYADAHLIANAPEWLRFLLDELERLKRDKLIKLLDMIKDDADRFGELVGIDVSETSLEEKGKVFNRKIETLQKERDKLIEGLQFYANGNHYGHQMVGVDVDQEEIMFLEVILYDDGQRARNILKEIGMEME